MASRADEILFRVFAFNTVICLALAVLAAVFGCLCGFRSAGRAIACGLAAVAAGNVISWAWDFCVWRFFSRYRAVGAFGGYVLKFLLLLAFFVFLRLRGAPDIRFAAGGFILGTVVCLALSCLLILGSSTKDPV